MEAFYYVTIRRDSRQLGALLGPFSTQVVAETWVDAVRLYVVRRYPEHAFDAFGVARMVGRRRAGRLSRIFGFAHHSTAA